LSEYFNQLSQTHFHISGYVFRQDFLPRQKKSAPAPPTTARRQDDRVEWCAMKTFGMIDPYYFEDEGTALCDSTALTSKLCGSDKTEQQHTIHKINQHFVANVILQTADVQWRARSPTPKHHLICLLKTTSCVYTSYTLVSLW